MEQYISKSAVKAEIKGKIENINLNYVNAGSHPSDTDVNKRLQDGISKSLQSLLSFLDTLDVKEVDLEKELRDFVVGDIDDYDMGLAKHFFELGLKARTDKELVEEVYSHLDSIKDTADRMTSGNFMHNRAAIKFSANTIAKVLELMGLKAQKEK
jgi:hypothetical protein